MILLGLVSCRQATPPVVEIGENTQFTVGGVAFVVDRFSDTDAQIVARNGNDSPVRIVMRGIDTDSVPLSVSFLLGQKTTDARVSVVKGKTYEIEVAIWKDGFDLIACTFTDDSCFRDWQISQVRF